jgi:hypothetical protein
MKLQVKTILVLVVVPYMCAVVFFVRYVIAHPGPVPRWISLSMLLFLMLTVGGGGIVISRVARRQKAVETPEQGNLRRARARKGLKAGLVLYFVILLNGIRLIVQREIPLNYAIPGLVVDLLLIAVFWTSLRRLKNSEMNSQSSAGNPAR